MRRHLIIAFILAMTASTTAAPALEKSAVPMTEGRGNDGWAAGGTCSVSYYNTCNGWLWTWSGWSPTDIVGMTLDRCDPADNLSTLVATNLYAWSGAPSNYGFTGTVTLSNADANGCPTDAIASTPLLPASGNNIQLWGVPADGHMVVTYEHADAAFPDPIVWPTDHPAAGPTGPAACGTCYPTTRTLHSFYYGNATTALCPGSPLDDGVCGAEWLLWAAGYTGAPISRGQSSWGTVKSLYR